MICIVWLVFVVFFLLFRLGLRVWVFECWWGCGIGRCRRRWFGCFFEIWRGDGGGWWWGGRGYFFWLYWWLIGRFVWGRVWFLGILDVSLCVWGSVKSKIYWECFGELFWFVIEFLLVYLFVLGWLDFVGCIVELLMFIFGFFCGFFNLEIYFFVCLGRLVVLVFVCVCLKRKDMLLEFVGVVKCKFDS